ncbi:MAG: hypothetical protein AB7K24_33950 [Gemmataceae bacterium]
MGTLPATQYEIRERTRGIGYGGIGAMQLLVGKLGLAEAIDRRCTCCCSTCPTTSRITFSALGRWSDTSTLEIAGIDRFADGTTVVRCLKRTGKLGQPLFACVSRSRESGWFCV